MQSPHGNPAWDERAHEPFAMRKDCDRGDTRLEPTSEELKLSLRRRPVHGGKRPEHASRGGRRARVRLGVQKSNSAQGASAEPLGQSVLLADDGDAHVHGTCAQVHTLTHCLARSVKQTLHCKKRHTTNGPVINPFAPSDGF